MAERKRRKPKKTRGKPSGSSPKPPKGQIRVKGAQRKSRPAVKGRQRSAKKEAAGTPARPKEPAAQAARTRSAAAVVPPWSVKESRVATLTDLDLRNVMRELLLAECYKAGGDRTAVVVNSQLKAGDEGEDGRSPAAPSSPWMSDRETCWQLKAGVSSEPNRLQGEVLKPRPRATLSSGGRFVVVASRCEGGTTAEDKRRKVLLADAKGARLPISAIEVLGTERLATWISEHPAVAITLEPLGGGWLPLERWERDHFHSDPWCPTEDQKRQAADIRRELDSVTASVIHFHISGPPGVGKTRFALEVCREAPWRHLVIYVPDSSAVDLASMLYAIESSPERSVILVADEVMSEDLVRLTSVARAAHGRIRLITIGDAASTDQKAIPNIELKPLDRQAMQQLVRGSHPNMPLEAVVFVADFADGYARLARLAAQAIEKNPSMNARDLLEQPDIRQLMDAMLGNGNREALHVLSVLASVGWRGAAGNEGQVIAKHLGKDWSKVQSDVVAFHKKFNIAPAAGDYRYISPTPLGVYLAVEAWESYPDAMRDLDKHLPSGVAPMKPDTERVEVCESYSGCGASALVTYSGSTRMSFM